MITLYRPAGYDNPRAPEFTGRSIDTKPNNVENGASSSVNVPLSNGAYLLTVSDDMHGGLVFVSVYPSGETINGLVNLNNWKCERISSGSGVTLTNSTTSAMTVYITSIGEGTYR